MRTRLKTAFNNILTDKEVDEMTSLMEEITDLIDDIEDTETALYDFEEDLKCIVGDFDDALDTIKRKLSECDSKAVRLSNACSMAEHTDGELPF